MVRPITNCLLIIRMALSTAFLTTASLLRLTNFSKALVNVFSAFSGVKTLPVSIKAQVVAFTKNDSLCPRCAPQSPPANLSLIKLSMVALSGTRNNASARHIKAIPSSLDKAYSVKKESIPVLFFLSLRTD